MKSAAQSPAQPAPMCAAGSQTNTQAAALISHSFYFCCLSMLMKCLIFSYQGCSVTRHRSPQRSWCRFFISLDCKCSFEPQAAPCSRTWRRNISNTLCLGESFPSSLAMLCCGEEALISSLGVPEMWGVAWEMELGLIPRQNLPEPVSLRHSFRQVCM